MTCPRPSHSALRRPVALVVVSLLVATGLPGPTAAKMPHFSGPEVFRGLFFGTGPVADLFPEVWDDVRASLEANRSPEEVEALRSQVAELESRVIRWIEAQDSKFFATFGEHVQSGDHVRIEEALDAGAAVLTDALAGELGIDPREIEASGVDESGVLVVVAVFAAVAVFALAVAVLNVAVFREEVRTKGANSRSGKEATW